MTTNVKPSVKAIVTTIVLASLIVVGNFWTRVCSDTNKQGETSLQLRHALDSYQPSYQQVASKELLAHQATKEKEIEKVTVSEKDDTPSMYATRPSEIDMSQTSYQHMALKEFPAQQSTEVKEEEREKEKESESESERKATPSDYEIWPSEIQFVSNAAAKYKIDAFLESGTANGISTQYLSQKNPDITFNTYYIDDNSLHSLQERTITQLHNCCPNVNAFTAEDGVNQIDTYIRNHPSKTFGVIINTPKGKKALIAAKMLLKQTNIGFIAIHGTAAIWDTFSKTDSEFPNIDFEHSWSTKNRTKLEYLDNSARNSSFKTAQSRNGKREYDTTGPGVTLLIPRRQPSSSFRKTCYSISTKDCTGLGGLGNIFSSFLYLFLSGSDSICVKSDFLQMFQLHPLSCGIFHSDCVRVTRWKHIPSVFNKKDKGPSWPVIFDTIASGKKDLQSKLLLNTRKSISQLFPKAITNAPCAYHVRFGDQFLDRKSTRKYDKDKRTCSPSVSCFDSILKKIKSNCGTKSVYLATDLNDFHEYAFNLSDGIRVLNLPAQIHRHTSDTNEDQVMQLALSDWVSLIYANRFFHHGRSSFSKSAEYIRGTAISNSLP